nr:hypothetical protein [Tanacetum cinerariifolium]GFA49205.1 hypothetical protein [Tanacetum cinerariifolium]
CMTRTFALEDKPDSFFAPEGKLPRRGLNPRPLACGNNLPKDQPLPADASPIAASPDYVTDFNPEEGPKEDPEDDQADYPADGGDGDDDPSDDDNDEDTDDEDPKEEPFEENDEEEEEHLALADSFVVPIVDHVRPAGDTEALEADETTHEPG